MPPQQQQPDEQTLAALTLLLLSGQDEETIRPRVVALLEPFGISAIAAAAALSLLHPHAPPVDLTQNPTTAQGHVARTEVPYSAAYLANAALRLTENASPAQERTYLAQHLRAQGIRREAAQRVDAAARMFGPLLGWRSVHDARTTPACKAAHGHNFSYARPPRIGYPGSLHGGGCRCLPGPPWPGASTVDDATHAVIELSGDDFDPSEPRDDHGRWTILGAIKHALENWPWKDHEVRDAQEPYTPRVDRPFADQWLGLTQSRARAAVRHYSAGGYKDLNNALREIERNRNREPDELAYGAERLTDDQTALRDALRDGIANAPEYPDEQRPVVWRGIKMGPDTRDLPTLETFGMDRGAKARMVEERVAEWARGAFTPGDTVELGGFQSTSFDPLPALNAAISESESHYGPGVIFEIRARHGVPVWEMDPSFDDESELLLSDQARFRVLGVLTDVPFVSNDEGDTVPRTVVQLEQL